MYYKTFYTCIIPDGDKPECLSLLVKSTLMLYLCARFRVVWSLMRADGQAGRQEDGMTDRRVNGLTGRQTDGRWADQ
jgi:hypothetical protein